MTTMILLVQIVVPISSKHLVQQRLPNGLDVGIKKLDGVFVWVVPPPLPFDCDDFVRFVPVE